MRIRSFSLAAVLLVGAARATHADPMPPTPRNNLHIGVRCAYYLATPAEGLRVTIDGAPAQPFGVNGETEVGYTRHGNEIDTWVPTDVGFDVALGRHHLTIETPDCAPETRDLDVAPATLVDGRMTLDNPSLMGPVGAPNGLGMSLAGTMTMRPAVTNATNSSVFGSSTYSLAATTLDGVALTTSFERRHFALAMDMSWTSGSATGTGQANARLPGEPVSGGPIAFTEGITQLRDRIRIGARLPLHSFELAGGLGLGLDVELASTPSTAVFAGLPDGASGDFFVPVWAAATFKPACDWGVQALASYDVQPFDPGTTALSVGVGLMYQPSASCSEPAGVTVQ